WSRRLLASFRRTKLRAEIREELDHHAALSARDGRDRHFGRTETIEERTRDMDILVWLETSAQDLRHALRMLGRAPGFTAIVVLSLALGIGANAAIFSVMDALVLRTLPVPNPDELAQLLVSNGKESQNIVSYPLYQRMRAAVAPAAELGAFTYPAPFYIPQPGLPPQAISGELVSGEYFSALETTPLLGRLLLPSDNQGAAGAAVAVASYNFWRERLGGTASAIGRHLLINGVNCEIVGVARPSFGGFLPDSPPDVWMPLLLQPRLRYNHNASSDDTARMSQPWAPQEGISWLMLFARAPGAAGLTLAAQLTPILSADSSAIGPGTWHVISLPGARGSSGLRRSFSQPLYVLLGMVAMMLLIGCANVAALLLARNLHRSREIALRLALGISRGRLIRQLIAEGLVLGALAGAAALALAQWGGAALTRLAVNLPTSTPLPVRFDARLLAFVAGVSLLVGILVSLLPVRQASQLNASAVLKAGPSRFGRLPFGRALIVAQVAVALLLVTAAGLFSRSLGHLDALNPGFDRLHVLNLRTDTRVAGIPAAQWPQLYARIHDAVAALPGVRAAAFSECPLPSGCTDASDLYFPGASASVNSDGYTVGRDYFATVGMRLLQGRGFTAQDAPHTAVVAIVNQAFASKFLPGRSPLGQHFGTDLKDASAITIVGVVADARIHNLRRPAPPQFFTALDQNPEYMSSLQVRATGDPAALAPAVEHAISAIAPSLPVSQVLTTETLIRVSLADELLLAHLSDLFGLLALLLACLGLYGVITFQVARRTPEFGLRLALGAPPSRLLSAVLREALLLVALGLAFGLPLAFAAARLLQHALTGVLIGVSAFDPASVALAALLLLAVPIAAALIPALRAARVDPLAALRSE
ncbi:MAG TPA: ADOP family duplicated permease, partial [Terriglobales bacterium]|nr:ADOP family duplicated permease [Terriglobales bacterium]